MSENIIYADLNLTKSTKPRLQKATDVQGPTYAEVKVQSLDINTPASGKSRSSRTRVAVFVVLIILLLALAVCLIILFASSSPGSKMSPNTSEEEQGNSAASSPPESNTSSNPSEEAPGYSTASSPPESNTSSNPSEEAPGCPQDWERHGEKCYFFSPSQKKKDWNASSRECTDMDSDLVIIDNVDELNYLFSRSEGHYYLLGLTRSEGEMKWKWINNMEYNSALFKIEDDQSDYFCTVVGHGKVSTAPCSGSESTRNMCEKDANILEEQGDN